MKKELVVDISYDDDSYREVAPEELVRKRIVSVLEALGVDPCELSLSFVSDVRMQELKIGRAHV